MCVDPDDIYKYFIKFDQIETLKIKREGGYGFLMFKTRMGPLKVFEHGEFHVIKGFKVAVCSYQIESRKVLARDNLKVQTTPQVSKPKKPQPQAAGALPSKTQETKVAGGSTQNLSLPHNLSYVTGKGSHLDSTANTRTPHYHDRSQGHDSCDFRFYGEPSLFQSQPNNIKESADDNNDLLLQEVMKEIEELEYHSNTLPKRNFGDPAKVIPYYAGEKNQRPSGGYGLPGYYAQEYHQDVEQYDPYEQDYSHDQFTCSQYNEGALAHAAFVHPGHRQVYHQPSDYPPPRFSDSHVPARVDPQENAWLRQIDSEDPLLLWDGDSEA